MDGLVMLVSASQGLGELMAWLIDETSYSLIRSSKEQEALKMLDDHDVKCIMIDLIARDYGAGFLNQIAHKAGEKSIPVVLLRGQEGIQREIPVAGRRVVELRTPFSRSKILTILDLLLLKP